MKEESLCEALDDEGVDASVDQLASAGADRPNRIQRGRDASQARNDGFVLASVKNQV
ncbi:hypothetical protein BH24CHL3_BH24CHL3_05240 [soil metagenome]